MSRIIDVSSSRRPMQLPVPVTVIRMGLGILFQALLRLGKYLLVNNSKVRKVTEPLLRFRCGAFLLSDFARNGIANILVLSPLPMTDVFSVRQQSGHKLMMPKRCRCAMILWSTQAVQLS